MHVYTLAWIFFLSLSLLRPTTHAYAHNVKRNLVFIYWEKIKVVWWLAGACLPFCVASLQPLGSLRLLKTELANLENY